MNWFSVPIIYLIHMILYILPRIVGILMLIYGILMIRDSRRSIQRLKAGKYPCYFCGKWGWSYYYKIVFRLNWRRKMKPEACCHACAINLEEEGEIELLEGAKKMYVLVKDKPQEEVA